MIWSIPSVDTAAARAGLACVAWIDKQHRDAGTFRLVRNEGAKLCEGPGVQTRPLATLGLNPPADMRQFFKRNTKAGAFGSRNDHLRDFVVDVFPEAGLPSREFAQTAFSRFGAASLQTGFAAGETRADTFDALAAVQRPVAVGGNIDDAEIDAEPIFGFELLGFGNVAGSGEIPLAAHEAEIDLALAVGHQTALVLTHHEIDDDAAFDRPDADGGCTLDKADYPIVIGLSGIRAKDWRSLPTDFEGVSHLGDRPHGSLRRQAEAVAQVVVGDLLQIELAKIPGGETSGRKPCRRLVAAPQGSAQCLGLLGRGQELYGGDEFHRSNIERHRMRRKPAYRPVGDPLSLPMPEGRGISRKSL